MSCMDCRHFKVMGANKNGRHFGMCLVWDFSINENDDRNCKKKELKNDRDPRPKVDAHTREGLSDA